MPSLEDLFLAEERQGIAVLAGDDAGEQAGGGDAALLEDRERRNDRGRFRIADGGVFAPDDVAPQEVTTHKIELFGDYLTDETEPGWVCQDNIRIDDLFDNWKVLRQARPTVWSGAGGRGSHRRRFLQRITCGGGRSAFGGIGSGHEEFQLGGIHLLAPGPENPFDQSIDLPPEKFVLLPELRDLPLAFGERSGQFGFERRHE